MTRFRVIVRQIVPDDKLTPADRRANLAGRYLYAAKDKAIALAQFRREFMFARPDDYRVEVEVYEEMEGVRS
jgi:hypothetical protein